MSKPIVLSMRSMKGHGVRNPEGEDLGKIDELVLNEDGRVLYAVLSFGGVLHMGEKLVAVPWERMRMEGDQKGFIMDADKELLQNAPHFTRDFWPDMSLPEWQERTASYFRYRPAETPEQA